MNEHRYFIINKPYNMVSQFVSPDEVGLLGDLNFDFPEGIHAIGRLDGNSEGLLILTTDKSVTRLLFQGEVPHKRTYLVLVKNVVTEKELYQLRNGISIRIKGGGNWITTPCEVNIVEKPANLFKGHFELHKSQLHTWLLISLAEGKFHQVRKMVAAVHHRCLRLIRLSIEDLELGNLQPGEVREINQKDFFRLLKIKPQLNRFLKSNWSKPSCFFFYFAPLWFKKKPTTF